MEFDLLGKPPTLYGRRRLVTKELFDGVGYESWILRQGGELLGMISQNESGPPQ